MLRSPGTLPSGSHIARDVDFDAVLMWALTYLTMYEMMRNDLMRLLLMRAILLWILENGMYHIM